MKNSLFSSQGGLPAQMLAFTVGLFLSIGSLNAASCGRIVSFGDSLADTGKVFQATGGYLPPFPYYEGRFSNGIVWPEYLSQDLEVDLVSYAYGGAFTNDQNLWDYRGLPGFDGLADQVMLYLSNENFTVPESDLITIVAGSNDVFGNLSYGTTFPIPSAALNTLANVQLLIQCGAQHVVVMAIPDLSSTPEFSLLPGSVRKDLKELVKMHNTILKKGLYQMRKAYRVDIIYVNIYEELNTIIENPGDYGITDTSTPGFDVLVYVSPEAYFAETFLFWDGVHPTTSGHRLLADAVYEALVDHYGADCED